MAAHKPVVTVVIETDAKVTKKAVKECVELALRERRVATKDPQVFATITKARVRQVDLD